jgi:hypothetical protein
LSYSDSIVFILILFQELTEFLVPHRLFIGVLIKPGTS